MVLKVGAYDVKKMPAVLLFADEDCQEGSSRYFLDPEFSDGTEYDEIDMARQNTGIIIKAVMVPPMIILNLYPERA